MPDERPEQAQVPPPLHSHVPNLEQFLQELYLFRAQYEASQTVQQLDLQSAIDTLSNAISVVSVAVGGGGISVAGTANQLSLAIAGTLRTFSFTDPAVFTSAVRILGSAPGTYLEANFNDALNGYADVFIAGGANPKIDLYVNAATGIGSGVGIRLDLANRVLGLYNTGLGWAIDRADVGAHLYPNTDQTADLGKAAQRPRDVYVGRNLQVSGTISAPTIDTLSNAISVLSQQVSVLSQQISVHSQQISVLSQQISVLSQGLSVVSNAASNALSVANAASNAASVVSVAAANATSIANAVSAKADTLSNQISVLSQQVSVLSQQVSVLSQAVSVLSQSVSVLSNTVSAISARMDTLSNAVSVISQAVSVLSQSVSVLSQAVSVISQQVSVLSVTRTVEGQCRLSVKSTTSITLQPYKGQMLWINGAPQKIPSGGVDMPTTGLTSATTYNLYAYMSATVMTLTATVSAHATDTTTGNVGVEILAGDSTRTLVGMVRLNASVQFVNSVKQRFLINWFNRKNVSGVNNFTANRTTTSGTYVEVNTEIRIEFLTWGDEDVLVAINGAAAQGAVNVETVTSFGFDGTNQENANADSQAYANGANVPAGLAGTKTGLAEGYHYVTLLGLSSDGVSTATWFGGTYTADTTFRRIVSLHYMGRG